jgi:hypothetical protein
MKDLSSARRASLSDTPRSGAHAGPTLLPSRPQPYSPHSVLALWHLLSLDAPTVAALWTVIIAHCAGLTLGWTAPAAMFVAVWMIYAADRLLDSRQLDDRLLDARLLDARLLDAQLLDARLLDARLLEAQLLDRSPPSDRNPPPDLEARHRFHHQHRRRFLAIIILASLGLVFLLHRIAAPALHLYALLATLLAAWLLLIHVRPLPTMASHRLPKELAVGLFFPAAVFIPTVARDPSLRLALLPAAALFAAVCTLNCLFVYAWEHPAPRLHAHWTTRWATGHLIHLAALVVAVAALVALSGALRALVPTLASSLSLSRWPALACALSAGLLLVLHLLRRRFSGVHLRASADLVLLTPLLVMALAAR